MIWLVCAGLVILAGCYVLSPLFQETKEANGMDLPDETELDRLLDRKAVIYDSLKDLNFEHAMGRLTDADYRRLEADYKNDAALLLQKLDQLGDSKDLDNAIEKNIAARKAALFTPAPDRKTRFCPSCSAAIIPGKKYCADCGERL